MNQRIRVIIADDHPVILFGAEQALLQFPEIEVVGAGASVNRTD